MAASALEVLPPLLLPPAPPFSLRTTVTPCCSELPSAPAAGSMLQQVCRNGSGSCCVEETGAEREREEQNRER